MRLLSLLALALALSLGACDSNGSTVSVDIRLLNLDGDATGTGTLTFDDPIRPGVRTGGTFAIGGDMTRDAGSLEAVCEYVNRGVAQLSIDLGPRIPDGGRSLVGTCGNKLAGGNVVAGTIAGPVVVGRFEFVEVVYDYH